MELHCKEDNVGSEGNTSIEARGHSTGRPVQGASQNYQQLMFLRTAPSDNQLLNDGRVLHNMLELEERHTPSSVIFSCIQKDIEPWMRNKVAVWMLEVCEEEKCESTVFPTSVNFLDKVLSVLSIRRTQLQLLATACMFLASKLRETIPLNANRLVIYTDNSITLKQLLDWEVLVLQQLKWDLSTITPHDFLPQILCRLPLNKQQVDSIHEHSQTLIALAIATDIGFVCTPPSMVAAASVSSNVQGMLGQDWCRDNQLPNKLQSITGIEYDYLLHCQEKIEKALSQCQPESGDEPLSPPSTPQGKGAPHSQPTTPTDVRDINLYDGHAG